MGAQGASRARQRPVRTALRGLITACALVVAPGAAAPGAIADPPTQDPYCAAPFAGAAARTADPANPLGLASAPGDDPLRGATFFVAGPKYGHAAAAIADLLAQHGLGRGSDSYDGSESWTDFKATLEDPTVASKISANPSLSRKIRLLEKIATEPETARFSVYSGGGGAGAVYRQVQLFLCRINKKLSSSGGSGSTRRSPRGSAPTGSPPTGADSGVAGQVAVPMISTYFLVHESPCGSMYLSSRQVSTFKRQVSEFAHGLYGWSAVVLDEIDALDTAPCLSRRALAQRLALLRWMIGEIHADAPHVVQFVEGGADDAECAGFVINALNVITGASSVVTKSCRVAPRHGRHQATATQALRGFFLGDTHFDWTLNEVSFGRKIARLTGLHFVVATQDNGHGPETPSVGKVQGGNEVLCNPSNAGLGPRPTTETGFAAQGVDAFVWSGVPGLSGGNHAGCNGVTTPPGLFDLGFALQLARNASEQLGPRSPRRPY